MRWYVAESGRLKSDAQLVCRLSVRCDTLPVQGSAKPELLGADSPFLRARTLSLVSHSSSPRSWQGILISRRLTALRFVKLTGLQWKAPKGVPVKFAGGEDEDDDEEEAIVDDGEERSVIFTIMMKKIPI